MGKDKQKLGQPSLIQLRIATEKVMRRLGFAAVLIALIAACLGVALVTMKERPSKCQPQNPRVNYIPLQLPTDPALLEAAAHQLFTKVRHLIVSEASLTDVSRMVVTNEASNVTYLDTKDSALRRGGLLFAVGGTAALSHTDGLSIPRGATAYSATRLLKPRCGKGRTAIVEPSYNVDSERWLTSAATWRGPNGAMVKLAASGVVSSAPHRCGTLGQVWHLFPGIREESTHSRGSDEMHPVRAPRIDTVRFATRVEMSTSNLVFVLHSWRQARPGPHGAAKGSFVSPLPPIVPPQSVPATAAAAAAAAPEHTFGFMTVHPDNLVDNAVDAAVAVSVRLMLSAAKELGVLPRECHGTPTGLCDNPVTTFLDRGAW